VRGGATRASRISCHAQQRPFRDVPGSACSTAVPRVSLARLLLQHVLDRRRLVALPRQQLAVMRTVRTSLLSCRKAGKP